ncbi:glycerophosphodiester phosphodiesterase [Xylophilus sp. Kf1]|nr:glycerophosphodiester phosphodiesterase [Xylophilus sp. Kf1]
MNQHLRQFWVRVAVAAAGFAGTAGPAQAFDLQGHRGARGLAPENTLAAFDKALEVGVDTLEMDVAITADGVLVVSHDARLNPAITRDSSGRWLASVGPPIRSLPLAALADYDVGRLNPAHRYGVAFPRQVATDGQRIPTLEGLLQHLARKHDRRVRLNIEIKSDPYEPDLSLPPEQMVGALLKVLRTGSVERRTTVQSFDWRVLAAMREQAPDITRSCLTSPQTVKDVAWTMGRQQARFDSVAAMVADAGCDIWSPAHASIGAADVDQAHRLNLAVVPWTVNRPADMRRLLDLGVDGFITDEPDAALPLLAERGRRPPTRD